MLLFSHLAILEFRSLHLKGQHAWQRIDPSRRGGLVPLAVLLVVVIGHLPLEDVLPRPIKVSLILHVQHDIILDLGLRSQLGLVPFVRKLDQILDLALEHLL